MNLKNKIIFAVLSFSIVALIIGNYNSAVQPGFITAFAQENQTGTENEAEVEADIEQENKCKKDTECENENELNNDLSILNITQTGAVESGPTTLNVIKILQCEEPENPGIPVSCGTRGPEDFTITVTGNNPSPSEFPGSEEGTLVTLGAGDYEVNESFQLNLGEDLEFTVSGDCAINEQEQEIQGTIEEGQSQTCTLSNTLIFGDRR